MQRSDSTDKASGAHAKKLTSRATVRFMVRTRAARGRRASTTLSMKVGSCVMRIQRCHLCELLVSDEKDLGKDCSELGGPEEDDRSQNYESCSHQSQTNLKKKLCAASKYCLPQINWVIIAPSFNYIHALSALLVHNSYLP